MRKTKVIYALIASAMLSLALTGCGSSETIDNDLNVESTTPAPTDAVDLGGVVDSDDVTPTSEPTAEPTATSTPTPEPTETVETTEAPSEDEGIGMVDQITGNEDETPEPTVEPTEVPQPTEVVEPTEVPVEVPTSTPQPTETPKTDWFSENGYKINGVGDFSYIGFTKHRYIDKDTEYAIDVQYCTFDVSEVDNGDGTKTVTGVFTKFPHIFEDGAWDCGCGFDFVADRYTGTALINYDYDQYEDFSVTLEDGTEINITIYELYEKPNNANENVIDTFKVTVPVDYDGLVFGTAPTNGFNEWGSTMSITEIIPYFYNDACEFAFFADKEVSEPAKVTSSGTWWLDNNIETVKLGEGWEADETAWFSDSYWFELASENNFFVEGYEYPDVTTHNTYHVYVMETDTNIAFMSCKVIDKYTGLVLDRRFSDWYHYCNPEITFEDGRVVVCATDSYTVGGGPNGHEFNFYISVPVEYDGALFCVGYSENREFIPTYYFEP